MLRATRVCARMRMPSRGLTWKSNKSTRAPDVVPDHELSFGYTRWMSFFFYYFLDTIY